MHKDYGYYKEGYKRNFHGLIKRFLLIFLILFVLSVLFIYLFYYKNCETQGCFDESLRECKRARFITKGDMVFEYVIEGKKDDKCIVEVKLLQGDLSDYDFSYLSGRTMRCYLPLGVIVEPESDIKICHGELKEGLQDLIITKLHSYIVQNLGKINSELLEGI